MQAIAQVPTALLPEVSVLLGEDGCCEMASPAL